MSIKFLASEFSPKVKAYNSIEENILRHRLDAYQRQTKTNLRMIEKDTKKFQEDYNDKLRVTKNNYLNENAEENDELLANGGNGHLSDQSHQKSLKHSRKRRKKKTKKRDKEKKSSSTSDTITNETFLYKSATDGELEEMQKTTRNSFLPRLNLTNNTDLKSSKPTKSSGYLSLPPIKNSGLTSSVSLPSLNKFNKKT